MSKLFACACGSDEPFTVSHTVGDQNYTSCIKCNGTKGSYSDCWFYNETRNKRFAHGVSFKDFKSIQTPKSVEVYKCLLLKLGQIFDCSDKEEIQKKLICQTCNKCWVSYASAPIDDYDKIILTCHTCKGKTNDNMAYTDFPPIVNDRIRKLFGKVYISLEVCVRINDCVETRILCKDVFDNVKVIDFIQEHYQNDITKVTTLLVMGSRVYTSDITFGEIKLKNKQYHHNSVVFLQELGYKEKEYKEVGSEDEDEIDGPNNEDSPWC